MKKIFFILICVANIALSQDKLLPIDAFNRYEEEKKEKSTALIWSSIIPGSGLMYSGNIELGMVFCIGEIFLGSKYLSASPKHSKDYIAPLVGAKILELILTNIKIDSYNGKLREGLGIGLVFQDQAMMNITYTF